MISRVSVTVLCAALASCGGETVSERVSNVESQLTRLRAYNDATSNHYAFDFTGTYDFHRVYIDTDENAATGFDHCGLGANYMIENTRLYSYTGDGSSWSWSQIATLTPAIGATSAAWSVARSSLSESAFPNRANVCFETEDAADVRDTSAIYAHVYSDETLPIHAQVASNDASTVYYQATFDIAFTHKHVFIDADENAATGYETGGIGADFMVENSSLYDYTGDGDSWSWTSLGSANMSTSGSVTTWSIARSALGTTTSTNLVFHGNPAAGGSSTYTAIYDHVYSGGSTSPPLSEDTGYTADPSPTLMNPERGMYFSGLPGSGEFHTIVPEWLYLDTVCDDPLVWNGHNVSGTSPVLNAYATKLVNARNAGVKVLFRPRYDTPGSNVPNGCGLFHALNKTLQLAHIDAVAAMLGDFRDVIGAIQMGYLGRYGEWNTAGHADSTAPLLYSYTDRSDIIDRVLLKYGAEGIQQHAELRRPVFAKEVLDRNPSAKVGLHNDCFMTTSSDMGTYSDFTGSPANFGSTSAAKAWAQAFTANASFGGETCPSGGGERWRSCSNMIGTSSEPGSLHMNYLNGEWAADAVSTWTSGGCYDEIRRKLGYRFEVTRVAFTPAVAAGQPFTVQVDIRNTGWAKLHRPRTAKLVLRSGAAAPSFTLANGATATWAPGSTTTLSVTANAPSTPGTYSVRLAIPDPDAPARIPYAVKLASQRGGTNVFDATTGENNLGVSITVQ
jgi:hypothetical protein